MDPQGLDDTVGITGDGASAGSVTLDSAGLADLLDRIIARGHAVVGPTVTDGAIHVDRLTTLDDLPAGWTDDQAPGRYRLERRGDDARFGFAVGPTSPKQHLHPPRTPVWTMERTPTGRLEVTMTETSPQAHAFFGVRPCEFAAMRRQDHVLANSVNPDTGYQTRRADNIAVVANCGEPASTCFCASMGTGPFLSSDDDDETAAPDIEITELVADDLRYVATPHTATGADLLAGVATTATTPAEASSVDAVRQRSAARIERHVETTDLRERLFAELENERWDDIGERCLSCGNCTSVCPTCFCTNPVDTTDLSNDVSIRERVWDTCFSASFSQLGSHPVRASTSARYRQWATHKLASWIDQFGESGCVGCGRCITWCPVGIDLTAEVNALVSSANPKQPTDPGSHEHRARRTQ